MKILGSPLAPGKFFTLGDVVGRVEIRMEMEKSEENDVTTPAPCGTELQSWLQCAKNATEDQSQGAGSKGKAGMYRIRNAGQA